MRHLLQSLSRITLGCAAYRPLSRRKRLPLLAAAPRTTESAAAAHAAAAHAAATHPTAARPPVGERERAEGKRAVLRKGLGEASHLDRVASGLLKTGESATVVETTLEELHAHDAKDEEDEGAEHRHVAHLRHHAQDRAHQHWHTGHALERPQRTQSAHRADDRIVSKRREDDRNPSKAHHHKIELRPTRAP